MNPSARGWINKLITLADLKTIGQTPHILFYKKLRQCGFIYGSNISVADNSLSNLDYTNEERCKINFILALYNTHSNSHCKKEFISTVIEFYKIINVYKTNFFSEFLGDKSDTFSVEKIIHKRIQIDSNALTKNFKFFITNALLYVDILAYNYFLNNPNSSEGFIKHLETTIETIVYNTLNVKSKKSKYDDSLIKLLDSSMRYQNHEFLTYNQVIRYDFNILEAFYILDIACMATWSDTIIDHEEHLFLNKLSKDLNLNTTELLEAISSLNSFYLNNKENIALLSSKNIVKSFYDNSSNMVVKLISRNRKRLAKELKESKELVKLISQSTVRDLSDEEQKKINEQLLDIFKSIPSLAIFMLPGGAILLPIFIKFIPKLLPSSFDDNRIDPKKD